MIIVDNNVVCMIIDDEPNDTTPVSMLDILTSPSTTTTTTSTTMPTTTMTRLSLNKSALVSKTTNITTTILIAKSLNESKSKSDFCTIMDGILLIFSNLALLPAIYIAIKGKFYAESIVYCFTMTFSALYHLCDCNCLHYCIFSFDLLQYGDFFTATLTLWCTAIIISNVPYKWISSFHLIGSIIFGTLLHYYMSGTWSFVVPAISTLLLVASFWGYRYYREHTIPELIYSNNFYIAIGLLSFGAIMFASQTLFYFRRLYGITHSLWHISMSLAIALLLPRYPNSDTSFWTENLKINSTIDNQSKPPIISIGKSINEINNSNNHSTRNLSPAPSPPTTTLQSQQHNINNDIMNFNSHVNSAFAL